MNKLALLAFVAACITIAVARPPSDENYNDEVADLEPVVRARRSPQYGGGYGGYEGPDGGFGGQYPGGGYGRYPSGGNGGYPGGGGGYNSGQGQSSGASNNRGYNANFQAPFGFGASFSSLNSAGLG